MLDIEELKQINQIYLTAHHSFAERDIENIKHLIGLIEFTRDSLKPKTGDIVKFTSKNGIYYENAIVSNVWENGEIEICEKPYTPFVMKYNEQTKNICMSVSGGIFHNFEPSMFKHIRKDKRKFCSWGVCGVCADGAIDFFATVNVWEVKQKNM